MSSLIGNRMTTPRVLWMGISMSTVMFLVVLLVVKHPEQGDKIMLPIMGGMALIVAALSFALPRQMHLQALARCKLEIVEKPDPTGMPMPGNPKMRREFADPKAATTKALVLWQAPYIIQLALTEAVAIFGFMLGFLGFPLLVALPFFVVAWILFAIRYPTEDKVLRPLMQIKRAHFPEAKS